MTDSVEHNNHTTAAIPSKTKKKRSIPRRIIRFLIYASLSFFLVLILLIGLTETGMFRNWLRDTLMEQVDKNLNATLSLGEIHGNIFTGLVIEQIRLDTKSGNLVSIKNIVIRYDLLQLPYKYLRLNEIALNEASVSLLRNTSGEWNFEHLSKDTTQSKGGLFGDWTLVLNNLHLSNCTLVVYDSTKPFEPHPNRVSFSHLNLKAIDLALNAYVSENEKSININQFSFRNEYGEFAVKNFAGDIRVTPQKAVIQNLSIQTNKSAIQLSVSIDSIDVLKPFSFDEFSKKHLTLDLAAPTVNLQDLQAFLPSLDILGSKAKLILKTEGTLQSLTIGELHLQTPESDIRFRGEVRDINKGAELIIRVSSDECTIDPAELPKILPGIPMFDLSGVGEAKFSKLIFDGRPLDFKAQIDMKSPAGDVKGEIALDVRKAELKYDAHIVTHDVNLEKVFRKPELNSSLNIISDIAGTGTKPGQMISTFKLNADSSRYSRYQFQKFQLNGSANMNEIALVFNATMGRASLAADTKFEFVRDSITSFHLIGDVASIDLAKIFNDDSLSSQLTFHVDARGNGLDPDRSSGTVALTTQQSEFRNFVIEPDSLSLIIDQQDQTKKSILLKTQYADLDVHGMFRVRKFVDYISESVDPIRKGIQRFALQSDTTAQPAVRHINGKQVVTKNTKDTSRFIDAGYSVTMKKPELIAKYFGGTTFILRGNYDGTISGGLNAINLSGNLRISDLYFIDTTSTILGAGLNIKYNFDGISPDRFLEKLHGDITVGAQDFEFNDTRLKKMNVQLKYADKIISMAVRGTYDTSLSVTMDAQAKLENSRYDVEIRKLAVDYLGASWKINTPMNVQLDTRKILISNGQFTKDNMLVRISGSRTFEGVSNISIKGNNLQLKDAEFLVSGNKSALEGSSFNGHATIELQVNGSDSDPNMALFIAIDSLSYKNYPIGSMTLEGTYAKQQVEVYSEMLYKSDTAAAKQVFFVSGIIPIDLSLKPQGKRILEKPASLSLRLKDFPLTIVEKFIVIFNQLEGTANADIRLTGTAENPEYTGALTIDKARGILKLNNMRYLMNAYIEPQKSSIFIRDFSVRNEVEDYPDGQMSASGKLDIENYGLKEFSISAIGTLKVLRNASRSATKLIYGDLYISTGKDGISYSGRLDRSKLIGNINLTRGNLILPAEQSGSGSQKSENISYITVDDTTKTKVSSLFSGLYQKRKSFLGKETEEETGTSARTVSLLDGLTYDLTLSTDGPVRIVMPFNSLTQEELNAQLVVDQLKVNNWGGTGKFIGEVKLAGDSYYLFFGKRFHAQGSLIFTGAPLNPELNLTAIYSDYHMNQVTKENRKIFVILTITGTKSKPIVAFDIRQDAVDGNRADVGDVQSDALSFIMTGSFTNELTSSEKGKLIDKAQGLSNTLASSLLSSAMSGFLQKAGLGSIVNRVEVSGLGSTDTRLRLTSEIGRAVITYDGRITDLGSSDIKVEIPINVGFANFILEVSRRTLNTSIEGAIMPQESSVYEAKILYRISF